MLPGICYDVSILTEKLVNYYFDMSYQVSLFLFIKKKRHYKQINLRVDTVEDMVAMEVVLEDINNLADMRLRQELFLHKMLEYLLKFNNGSQLLTEIVLEK